MPSMKAIKRKITSVSNTKQIMKAMNLVAASKLQKSRVHLEATRPIVQESKRIIDKVKSHEDVAENPYVKPREIKSVAYVVITSDKGLCGGYNANISKEVLELIEESPYENIKIIAVGLKAWEFFKRREKKVIQRFTGISGTARYEDAEAIGGLLSSLYISGQIDEAYVAYTQFQSTVSHIPHVEKILPFESELPHQYIYEPVEYEPDADTFLNNVAQMYINTFLYGAMADSATCEQAARMVSMDSASNNATEIIEDLSLMYNRLRQGSITQEINEIVSGTNALK